MGWVTAANNFKHSLVPSELVLEADKAALAAVVGQQGPTEPGPSFLLHLYLLCR